MGKMRPENLVVLRFCENDSHVEVVSNEEARVRIDLDLRQWFFQVGDLTEVYKIGETSRIVDAQGTTRAGLVIGVFDKLRVSHLHEMVHASVTALVRYRSC